MITSAQAEPLARGIFAALGGTVEIGAVRAMGAWNLTDLSVEAFLAHRQDDLRRLTEDIRSVCRI